MQNRTFCNLECLHCFCSLSKGIFNALKRYYVWPWNTLTVIKIVYSSPEAMVKFSGERKLKHSLSARQKTVYIVKFILKGQGIFSLDVNKILRLQVTLNLRYAKNVIRYSFFRIFAEGQESHVSQTV